jgi:hypothetical protein
MAKRKPRAQSRSLVVNLTPEQKIAFDTAQTKLPGNISQNDLVIGWLREFCEDMGIPWPAYEGKETGRNFAKDTISGKFVKKE